MIQVMLTKSERVVCEYLGKARHNANRRSGVVDTLRKKEDSNGHNIEIEQDIEAVCAEFAVAKFLNIYPDLSIEIRSGGYDLLSQRKSKIEVKHTSHPAGNLIATLKTKVEDQDRFVLVRGKEGSYNIIGWCTSEELIQESNIKNLGYGDTYFLQAEFLRPFKKDE